MNSASFIHRSCASNAPVTMATCRYSEDLQPQQASAVTMATPATTTPSSAKTEHFLSEIPPATGTISSATQAATASKTGQDALCSQAPPTQSQKPAVLTTPTQHYDIQQTAVQKSNGQSSPQYIIVTVSGEAVRSNKLYLRTDHLHQQHFLFLYIWSPSAQKFKSNPSSLHSSNNKTAFQCLGR